MKHIILVLFAFSILSSNLSALDKSWYSYDKAKHVTYSASIMYWTMSFNKEFNNKKKDNLYISAGITLSIGGFKELIDLKIKRTEWSWKDITADIAGIALGAVVYNNIKI